MTTAPTRASEDVVVQDSCIDSVPEPDTSEPVPICYTLFRPAGASADAPVPLVFHSHGWGGSRTTSASPFQAWLEAGFGVLSFDQRGFGESGGQAHVQHPDVEGQDVQRLVDEVATLDWVATEAPGDPVIGAIGGSYGGGYQLVGALTELRDRGATRFDALVPEITWWDLRESLAPQDVVRTAWASVLYAAGVDAHTEAVHKGFAYGAATGQWPKGEVLADVDLDAYFAKNGPAWHAAQGRRLDIPVLIGQGVSDNLFNLNQGLAIYDRALTPEARTRSLLVSYNGGHALPNALPAAAPASGDPCSATLLEDAPGGFEALARRFLTETLKGEPTGLTGHGRYHLATPDGTCVTVDEVAADHQVPLGRVATTSGTGPPVHWKLADGPLTVAGPSFVDATVTSAAVDGRAFFALSVGRTPADALVIQHNMLPWREAVPVAGARRTIELPAVTAEVPEGQSLFLTVSPVSDMSFGHGSRTPGILVLDDTVVRLPLVAPG